MANSLLTIDMVTYEALRLWKNTNAFMRMVDHQYDSSFAQTGAKIGDTLRIRQPVDYVVSTGPSLQVQDTSEQYVTLQVSNYKGVHIGFNTAERALQVDDYSKRYLAPAVNNLAGEVAQDMMTGIEGGASNFVSNVDASGYITNPTSETFLNAGAILDENSQTGSSRLIVLGPRTNARSVNTLSGLFNPQVKISEQYKSGQMSSDTLGFDFYKDQTVITHTTATYTSVSGANVPTLVNGANQTGLTVAVDAITGGLNIGDIITFEGVYAVNKITKNSTGQLKQFVVTANVATGGTSIPIYPAIVPPNGSNDVQYQTVTASPADNAKVYCVSLPGEVYYKNVAFAGDAITLATVDLVSPDGGVIAVSRDSYDGVSLRVLSAYIPGTDQIVTRLDVLYGYKWLRPEWAVAVADKLA